MRLSYKSCLLSCALSTNCDFREQYRSTTKPTKEHVRAANAQISLSIHGLVRIFAVRFMGSIGHKTSSGGRRRLWSAWVGAQVWLWRTVYFAGSVVLRTNFYTCTWYQKAIPYTQAVCKRFVIQQWCPLVLSLIPYVNLTSLVSSRRYNVSQVMRTPALCHMQTTKAQISLRIRAVWSAPLLFAA